MTKRISLGKVEIQAQLNKTEFDQNQITLVLVHGNSSSKWAFQAQVNSPELQQFNILAFDLAGHGESSPDPEASTNTQVYSIGYHADTVIAVIKEFGLREKIVLVGHSLGAHITTEVARRYSVAGMMNVQNTPIDTLLELPTALNLDDRFSSIYLAEVEPHVLGLVGEGFFKAKSVPLDFFKDFQRTDPLCRTNLGSSLDPSVPLNEVQFINNWDRPYKLVVGREDELTNNGYLEKLPFYKKVEFVNEAGHFPQYELPAAFNKILLRFCNALP